MRAVGKGTALWHCRSGELGFSTRGSWWVSQRMPKELVNAAESYFASPMKNVAD